MPHRSRTAALLTATTVVVVCMLTVGLTGDNWWWGAGWLGYPVVGALILVRRPGHNIGRLLWLTGALWMISWLWFQLDTSISVQVPTWLEVLSSLGGYLAWTSLVAIVVLFPSGHAESRTSSLLLWILGGVVGAVIVSVVFTTKPLEVSGRPNPWAVESLSGITGWVVHQGFVLVPLLMLAALANLLVRWRRSSGRERLQYRWLIWSVSVAVAVIAASNYLDSVVTEVPGRLTDLIFVIGLNAVPIGIGVAITRYRLYEIDRLVSRTVTYVVVTSAVLVLYGTTAWLVTQLLAMSNDVAVALGTLVAAGLLRPVHTRVQRAVDRRFNRESYDAERMVDAFGRHLRREISPEHAADELLRVVAQAVEPATVALWTRGSRP